MQQIQYVQKSHSKATENLVESFPVKEEKKLHFVMDSRKNMYAIDMIGLSWIFLDDDF